MLYPLKFKPILKEKIWGGRRLGEKLGKRLPAGRAVGESWELSGLDGNRSVVRNGPLKGNDLEELIEVYMGELVGDRVYERFGLQFPLLIKYLDVQQPLSVQVHPNDDLAAERHGSYGKTEMWYVVDCGPDAALRVGFDGPVTREQYAEHVERGTLPELMAKARVHPGDTFFIPAGTVHTIEGSVLIAEIQQASDITYRIYDWDRVGPDGRKRELQTDLAADAIDFASGTSFDVTAAPERNRFVTLKKCPYFTTNLLLLDGRIERNHVGLHDARRADDPLVGQGDRNGRPGRNRTATRLYRGDRAGRPGKTARNLHRLTLSMPNVWDTKKKNSGNWISAT